MQGNVFQTYPEISRKSGVWLTLAKTVATAGSGRSLSIQLHNIICTTIKVQFDVGYSGKSRP